MITDVSTSLYVSGVGAAKCTGSQVFKHPANDVILLGGTVSECLKQHSST